MSSRVRPGILVVVLVLGLVGCSGSPSMPVAPSQVPQPAAAVSTPPTPPLPTGPVSYAFGYTLAAASLSGVVSEVTPTGRLPVAGVSVYCDACGEVGHTASITDEDGFYRFPGDIAGGGGVWISAGFPTPLIVTKEGYRDPAGLPQGPVSQGWREVTITGDTRFDIELVRR